MKRKRTKMLLSCLLALLLLAVFAVGVLALTDPYDCRIHSGVTIGGLDVGGMTPWEAAAALNTALEKTLYLHPVNLVLPEETLVLTPDISGVKVHSWHAVREAYALGRKEAAENSDVSLEAYLSLDEEGIRQLLADYAARYDTELTQPTWDLTGVRPELATDKADLDAPGQVLVLTLGIPAVHLNITAVCGEIYAACSKALSPRTSGPILVAPVIKPEALPETPDLQKIHREISLPPVSDTPDPETYTLICGAYGYSFDLEAAEKALAQADWGETLSFPMEFLPPEVFGEDTYYQDILGSCETKHSKDENRNTNLRLVCEILNGVVLQPGEEFSYNGTVGERTAERGFKAAGAYSGNRLVKDIGGGVCQGSTTLYNCALLADLEILERNCHGITVSYIANGLDAAVNWATKTDLRFRNNFHFPIKIQAEVSDGYVKMKLLGTDEKDYFIEMKTTNGKDETRTYANSYKYKYDKETGELISKDLEARSVYYPLS